MLQLLVHVHMELLNQIHNLIISHVAIALHVINHFLGYSVNNDVLENTVNLLSAASFLLDVNAIEYCNDLILQMQTY